ncbi:MAG: fumarylacetoacetate hydrolase family protein, partial [Candidatus Zipacnadales bacterium]
MPLKLVTFTPKTDPCPGISRVGALVEESVYDLHTLGSGNAWCGHPLALAEILACEETLQKVRTLVEEARVGQVSDPIRWPLENVKLEAPVPCPGKLFALAGNYAEHIMESTSKRLQGTGITESDRATPRVFMKPPSTTVIGPGDPIVIGKKAQFVDWEAELGVIIGKPGKYIPRDEAMAHVGGITIINDVSERELRIWSRPEDREWDKFFDWLNGKWCDGFAPMGPCAVPISEIDDVDRLSLRLWVNGELKQDGNTGQMMFKIPDILEYISSI